MPRTFESEDHRMARARLRELAARWFHGEEGVAPKAGSEFLEVAVREIASLRDEAAREWFGHLNTWDLGGNPLLRAARVEEHGRDPPPELCEAACRESYVRRGLEGLLRRRGVGLEFLDYVYASATAEPQARWLSLDPEDPDAFDIELPLGCAFDDRYALVPRTLRFGEYADRDSVVKQARAAFRLGGRGKGGRAAGTPWWADHRKTEWWHAILAVLQREGRPAFNSTGMTNVSELYRLTSREATRRGMDPIDQSTFTRWFDQHWMVLVIGAPTTEEVSAASPKHDDRGPTPARVHLPR